MRTLLLFLTGLMVSLHDSLAQSDIGQNQENLFQVRRAKAVYVEALGSSGLNYSINYDMRFKPGHKAWGFRIGIAQPAQVGQAEIYTFPLMINKVHSNRRAALETGIGFLIGYRRLTYEDHNNVVQRRESIQAPAVANVGLRLQPLRTGVVWRLYWAPTWRIGSSPQSVNLEWFGMSLGIGFN